MSYSPLTIKRRNILGELYSRCDAIESLPVYMDAKSEEPIGTVDESLGRYVDAFSFHLPEDVCKRLSSSGYEVFIDYDAPDKNDRIKINHIVLVAKQPPVALPKRNATLFSED